jgi:anti-anti-sigma factor
MTFQGRLGPRGPKTRFDGCWGWVPTWALVSIRKPIRVVSERDGVWAILTVSGNLDITTVKTFDAEVDRVFSDGVPPTGLLVDIARLSFTDSSGIRAAVLAAQRVPGRFGLIQAPEKTQRLLSIKGLGTLLQSFPDIETAKAALS